METSERKHSIDVTLKKIFDMKMKQGHEMKKAHINETEFLRTFYFLKANRLYMIDISTKKIEEIEFTRGKEVIFINGNVNNEYLIIVMKTGNIYAIDNNKNIIHIKNLVVNSSLFESKSQQHVNDKNEEKELKIRMFCSNKLDKLIIANESFMTVWYRSDANAISNKNKKLIEEVSGTFYNISLEKEKKLFLNHDDFLRRNYFESISAVFGNNYFLGSFGRILYMILVPTDIANLYKLYLVDYLFRYENCNKFKAINDGSNSSTHNTRNSFNNMGSSNQFKPVFDYEYVKNIEKKVIYTYMNYSTEVSKENNIYVTNKDRIIQKFNTSGNCCAIMINCQYALNSTLFYYMTETSRFSTYKMFDLYTKLKYTKNEANKMFLWVEDLDWICDDLFLILVLSQGYFLILNINFQIVKFIDTSNSLINTSSDHLSCPTYIYNQKLKLSDKLQLLTSKKRTDYFTIYSSNYSICFQVNYKSYESRLLVLGSTNESFDDFLYILKYFQINHNENDSAGLFDRIHNYMLKSLKELYHTETENTMPNENVSYIFSIFVKFIRIFRSINQIHETNLTILSYLIGVSNDFFYHLINFKEIWLAYLFIDICENYLLKHLRVKASKNKLCDEQLSKGQTSYISLNPYHGQNPSLKCYNKIINKVLHSRLRLILLFFALIEFRNNQALNINVLYFVLAKLCIEKLQKHNLLDDVQLLIKVIIRNWKYLKTENTRAGGEEYILNGLTMNYRTEILSGFIHNRTPREDIKFDFFAEFIPLDGLQEFTDLHETYCRGEEESLVNEYNYINNIGIIQRWTLFYTNFFYNYLFEDIKSYIDNHVKQTLLMKKEIENISPEETNLSYLIYFNLTFYLLTLNNHIRLFLKYMMTTERKDISPQDETKILSEFSKIFMPFISPVDVPFIIFEFYSVEDNKAKKNLPYEINMNLNKLIVNYMKTYNFSINDTLDFIEFLIQSGFKDYLEIENYGTVNKDTNKNSNNINKVQKYLHSAFMFYFVIIHKLNQLHFLEVDSDLIFSIIDNMHVSLKQECYEFLFLILNGHLRYFLFLESNKTLSQNNLKYFEVVQNMIKTLFFKILKEDPCCLRKNIHEFVQISPLVLRTYLLESALFYEYKNLNKLAGNLFDSSNLLDISNYLNIVNKNIPNIFEELTKEKDIPIFDTLLNNSNKNSNSVYRDFSSITKNFILLTKSNNIDKSDILIFSIEKRSELIRKIIVSEIEENIAAGGDEPLFNDALNGIVDKIIIGNISIINSKLAFSIKLQIIKFLHLFNLLYVKYKCLFSINPQKEILEYFKQITYCMTFNKCDKLSDTSDMENAIKIIDYLNFVNLKDIKENDKKTFLEIIKNINIVFMKMNKDLLVVSNVIELLEKVSLENKDLSLKLTNLINNEMVNIKSVYEYLTSITSSNLKMMILLCFTDSYLENMHLVYSLIEEYANDQNTNSPMRSARKRYIKLAESFNNLIGIPVKNFIDFNENWQLTIEEDLFNFIINDVNEISNWIYREGDQNNNLNISRRSKFGIKEKEKQIELKMHLNEHKNTFSSENCNTSIDLHPEEEENDVSTTKLHKIKLSVKSKYDQLTKPTNNLDLDTSYVNIKKDEDRQSTNTVVTCLNKKSNKDLQVDIAKKEPIRILLNILIKVFFRRFKVNVFFKYREETSKKELEEIKIYNIKPKEGTFEVIVLKEKYVPNKEINSKMNNLNSSNISDNRKSNRNGSLSNSALQDNSLLEGNKDSLNLKPFDIININKFKAGKGDNSVIYKDLLNNKNKKQIQSTIKQKIEEIQEKLKMYEEMAMNLGQDFSNTFNK